MLEDRVKSYKHSPTVLASLATLLSPVYSTGFTTMDDLTSVVIDNGSGMCKAGCRFSNSRALYISDSGLSVAGDDAPRAVFPYALKEIP